MTPYRSDNPAGLDIDLGMGLNIEITVTDDADPDDASIGSPGHDSPIDDEEPAMSYLIKFDPNVTPAEAEAVLGHLTPPDEGIILAGNGAVIVRAYREFVDRTERQDCVTLVNAVHTAQWEPNRHQIQADPE